MEVEPKTPGRASFAGLSNRQRDSPSLKAIVHSLMSERDKSIKLAVTNAVAIILVVILLLTIYAVKIVLMPFIRPLSLALLFGSFLHPMKQSLSQFFKQILKEICEDDVPLLAAVGVPVRIFNRATSQIPLWLLAYAKELINFGNSILNGDFLPALLIGLLAISLLAIGGDSLIKLVIFVNLIPFFDNQKNRSMTVSDCSLHFLVRSFVMTQICWFRMEIVYLLIPIAVVKLLLWSATQVYAIARQRLSEQLDYDDDDEEDYDSNSDIENVPIASVKKDNMEGGPNNDSLDPEFVTPHRPLRRRDDPARSERANKSRHRQINDPVTSLLKAIQEFSDRLIKVFSWILKNLEGCLDTISASCVIGFMALIIIITAIYLVFQIYAESVYLVEKMSLFANTLFTDNPDLPFLPGGMTAIRNLLRGVIKDAYEHGREWIRKSIRQLINNAARDDFNSTQSILIEKQMVEFWDRTYSLYVNGTGMNSTIAQEDGTKSYDWDRLLQALQSLNFTLCYQILKQNWDTLVSVSNSLSKLLEGNLSLAVGILTAILSMLIMSGSVVLNFTLDLIIFTTTLYYLLCASGKQYKPIEIVESWLPRNQGIKRHKGFGSVDESINAAFTAFIKMMLFHGLSTWLLHRLFGLKVVFIPSVISAIFGALPFIAPFWASVPACLDLCISGNTRQAIIMILLAYLPSSYVSTEFYSEIKNAGHPYLTGLAIAGGLVVFGAEGALFGPMLLVCIRLLVIFANGYL